MGVTITSSYTNESLSFLSAPAYDFPIRRSQRRQNRSPSATQHQMVIEIIDAIVIGDGAIRTGFILRI